MSDRKGLGRRVTAEQPGRYGTCCKPHDRESGTTTHPGLESPGIVTEELGYNAR